jgi:dipeptidyl aminopeptidase/acylaminoacyl peptidase
MKPVASFGGVCLLLCAAHLYAQQSKTVDPADIVNLNSVSEPQISPDGREIAYVLTTPNNRCVNANSHIWLVPTDGSIPARPFILSGGSDESPRWSPDGKFIAFLSDRDNPLVRDGAFHFSTAGPKDTEGIVSRGRKETTANDCRTLPEKQIWLMPLNGGEATPLTAISGGVSSFKWSADGKRLAFIRQDQPTKQAVEQKRHGEDQIEVDEKYLFSRLWVYDLATQQARLITSANMNVDDFDWSPDGTHFIVRVSPTTSYNDHWYVSDIDIINATTGAVEKVALKHAAFGDVRWSPDGRNVVFTKFLPRGVASVPVIWTLDTGAETTIGLGYAATIDTIEWDAGSKSLTAAATEGASSVFLKVNASTGEITRPITSPGPQAYSEFTASGPNVAFVCDTPEHPGEVCLLSGGEERALTNSNPQVAHWKLGTSQELTWKSSKDGMTIHGVLLLPADYRSGRHYKTVVWVHGGPEEAYVSGFQGTWYDWMVVLASHGYVVLLPNPRGSDGEGTAFIDANYRDWGGGDFQDIMDGVNLLISRGIADPARLGIGGWSYGGFMTAWAVTHTDRFKAAVMGAGISDLVSAATTSDIAPSYWADYWGGVVGNSALLYEHSPVSYLEYCHTPTLVVVGEADARVTLSQSEEFYNGLRDLGRGATMVVYPREHHIFVEREHQIDSLKRMLQWYDEHLNR